MRKLGGDLPHSPIYYDNNYSDGTAFPAIIMVLENVY